MSDFEKLILQKVNELIAVSSNSSSWIQNLLSTIVGLIFGTLLTLFTQRIGKLNCYIISYSIKYYRNDEMGGYVDLKDGEIPDDIEIKITFDFQNSSQRNIGIRNIHLDIHQNRKEVLNFAVEDEDTRRNSNIGIRVDALTTLNIPPYAIMRKNVSVYVKKEYVGYFPKIKSIRLVYNKDNNRKVQIRISNDNDTQLRIYQT